MHKPMMTDLDWLREAVRAEEEYGGDIQIGGKLPVRRHIDPIKYKEQLDRVKLYSLLFGELKRLLHEVDFGAGTEAAYTKGRQLIVERMKSLTSEQEASLNSLLVDSQTLLPSQLQSCLRQQLHALLDTSDWQTITATALSAVESKLLKQIAPV
ncbi:MAG TPA: hypothetical protein V6C65_29750 [Allocoleopsis sp.]